MTNWRKTTVGPSAPLSEAVTIIDKSAMQICLVVDGQDRLLGTVTDGDIRRAILRAQPLSTAVETVMNPGPITVAPEVPREAVLDLMRQRRIHQLPVVDGAGRVLDLMLLDDLIAAGPATVPNWIVLMAGGLGMRLRPLTEDVPKPLLKVGSKPIIDTIIENAVRQGFRRFYVSVNYLGDMIKDHLGDGSRLGAEIRYLDENERLGTAGALSLIREKLAEPVVVMNGDLLTKANLRALVDYHRAHGAAATVAVRDYEFQVPYGVVRLDGNMIAAIDEKPRHHFFVNAGIYVLEPDVVATVPKNTFYDMPELLRALVGDRKPTVAFPVREYWLDVGRMDDFQQAVQEYSKEFTAG